MPPSPLSFLDFLLQLLPYAVGGGGLFALYISWKTRKSTVEISEASALQEMQKGYAQMVLDNETLKKELRNEIKKLQDQLQKYMEQCAICANNKIK